MPLTAPIPKSIKQRLQQDPFMRSCCLCKSSPVEWHHNFQYASKRVQEFFCILPVCKVCHDRARNKTIKELLDIEMLKRAKKEDLEKFPRVNWKQRIDYLSDRYGIIITVLNLA